MPKAPPPPDLRYILPYLHIAEARLDYQDERLGLQDQKIASQEARLALHDESLARQDKKLDEHDKALAQLYRDLQTLKDMHKVQMTHIDETMRRLRMGIK